MTQRVHLYDEGALIERLSTGIKKHTQEVIFLVGAPISAPTEIGGRGVPGVEGIIQLIREEFTDDGAQSAALEEELRNAGASRYQAAFQFLQGRRGQRCCNDIVRKAVLTSRRALINAAEIPPDEACRLMESDLDGWTLTRGTESLGSLIACHPHRFGNALLTTNFDPLIEVAIRRAGGKYFRTILHSDGYLGQTTGDGCHIIHLHGYWYGSDTLHTNLQLQQARPRLKSSLLSLLRNKLVVVSACGGWDDVFMTTLMEIVGDDSSYPDILWTFDTASPNNTDAIAERLEPGIQRGRVTLYTGIDCHHLFARLKKVWATLEPIETAESVPSNPVRVAALDLNAISTSAQQIHYCTDEDEDTPPFIEICVGRDTELERLRSSGASAVFLTGIGGQGKSTVAAHYFGEDSTASRFSIRIWRDCKGESDRFENQLAAVVEKLSDHRIRANELARQSASTIVSLLAKLINERDVLMVFDNVDHYVDLEAGKFVGGAHALVEGLLHSGCGSQAVFTCRPAVIYGQPNALSQRLEGIDLQATKQLFAQREALSSADEIREAHAATEGHAFWLDLLAIQVAKRAPEVTLPMLIEEIEVGGGPLPDKTLRSIWATLAKREQTVLRAMAETVKPAPAGEIAEYLGHLLRYDKVMQALRALRAMNLVVVKRRPRAADQLELHPLVRTLVRQQFSINERVYFINPIINFYLRLVGGKRNQLDQHPSLPVLHYWSQIAELYVASNQFEEAFKKLGDAADAFLSSAYPREFLRVTRLLLSKLDWVSEHYRFKGFEIVFHTRVKLLGYLGQYTEAEQLLDAYERTVPNKDTRYIHYCEMRSTLLWLKSDFTSAVQWGQIGKKLEDSGVDTEYDASHALALAERDSGHPETALPIFLDGETLATVLKHDALDRDRGGAFYGNIGRCLQFQGKLEDALVCYQKSALLVENDSSEHVLNQGYIRYWIGEVLLARGDRQLSQTFLTAAYAKWEQVAPPMANKVRSLLESLSPRADGNFGDQADAERICLQWIYGNDDQGRSPSV